MLCNGEDLADDSHEIFSHYGPHYAGIARRSHIAHFWEATLLRPTFIRIHVLTVMFNMVSHGKKLNLIASYIQIFYGQ